MHLARIYLRSYDAELYLQDNMIKLEQRFFDLDRLEHSTKNVELLLSLVSLLNLLTGNAHSELTQCFKIDVGILPLKECHAVEHAHEPHYLKARKLLVADDRSKCIIDCLHRFGCLSACFHAVQQLELSLNHLDDEQSGSRGATAQEVLQTVLVEVSQRLLVIEQVGRKHYLTRVPLLDLFRHQLAHDELIA